MKTAQRFTVDLHSETLSSFSLLLETWLALRRGAFFLYKKYQKS